MLISYTKCLHHLSISSSIHRTNFNVSSLACPCLTLCLSFTIIIMIIVCNPFSFKSCFMCCIVSCHSCQPSTNNLHNLGDQLIKCGFLLSPGCMSRTLWGKVMCRYVCGLISDVSDQIGVSVWTPAPSCRHDIAMGAHMMTR